MALITELLPIQIMFNNLKTSPIIINDLPPDKDHREHLFTYFNQEDVFSNIPQCYCGKLKGRDKVNSEVCVDCNTVVSYRLESEIEHILWFRQPNGVEALLNPAIFHQINKLLTFGGFSVFLWTIDTSYQKRYKNNAIPAVVRDFISSGIERGYNNFVRNFDSYLDILLNLKAIKTNKQKRDERDVLIRTLNAYRPFIFSSHLPLPNRALLNTEKISQTLYIDPMVTAVVDVLNLIKGIDVGSTKALNTSTHTKAGKNKALERLENKTVMAIEKTIDSCEWFYAKILSGKPGFFRRHMAGTKAHFTVRAVVRSITKPHDPDKIIFPYSASVIVFKLHIINKLFRRGYTAIDAEMKHFDAVLSFDQEIYDIMMELIAESPARSQDILSQFGYSWLRRNGICSTSQRNPSLLRGSLREKFIDEIGKDPDDTGVGESILDVDQCNMDFDGDAINYWLAGDNYMAKLLEPMSSYASVISPTQVRTPATTVKLPKPFTTNVRRWMADTREDPQKAAAMMKLDIFA